MDAERRAMRARELLDDPVLSGAFDAIEQKALSGLLRLPIWRGDRQRRALVERINIIRELKGELELAIQSHRQTSRPRPVVA